MGRALKCISTALIFASLGAACGPPGRIDPLQTNAANGNDTGPAPEPSPTPTTSPGPTPKPTTSPPGCVDTYANFGKAFFAANCDTCHAAKYGSEAAIKASVTGITSQITSGAMPKGMSLAAAEKTRVLAWLKCLQATP